MEKIADLDLKNIKQYLQQSCEEHPEETYLGVAYIEQKHEYQYICHECIIDLGEQNINIKKKDIIKNQQLAEMAIYRDQQSQQKDETKQEEFRDSLEKAWASYRDLQRIKQNCDDLLSHISEKSEKLLKQIKEQEKNSHILTISTNEQFQIQKKSMLRQLKQIRENKIHNPFLEQIKEVDNNLAQLKTSWEIMEKQLSLKSEIQFDKPRKQIQKKVELKINSIEDLEKCKNNTEVTHLELHLKNKNISDQNVKDIALLLVSLTQITYLYIGLQKNNLSDEGVIPLCQVLSFMPNLSYLSFQLWLNNLSDESATAFGQSLSSLNKLEELQIGLGTNQIGLQGTRSIWEVIYTY